jgi:hypothetical protein
MLQPHGDVEPVEVRRRRDAGIDQDRAQPRTAVGKRGQLGVGGVADLLEAALDQRLNRRIGLCDRCEHLTRPVRRLDVAEANFEMPLTVLAAADIGRIHAHGDCRGHPCRLSRGGVPQVLAELERAAAQGLVRNSGLDRQKVLKHAGGDPVRHEGGKVRPQLVEFGGRAAM